MDRITEYKSFSGGLKDMDSAKGIVCGYFASFNTVDRIKDVIKPGAFAKTIAETGPQGSGDIAHLQDHNKNLTVGMLKELNEDSTGLYFESKISKNRNGSDYLLSCEDGLIKSHSFAYAVIQSNKKEGIRYITEVKMSEGSGLQHGIAACNPNTPIVALKALELLSEEEKAEFVFDQLKLYQKAFKDGNYSDEYFINTIIPNLQALETEYKTLTVTTDEAEPITSKLFNPSPQEIRDSFLKFIK